MARHGTGGWRTASSVVAPVKPSNTDGPLRALVSETLEVAAAQMQGGISALGGRSSVAQLVFGRS